MCIYLHTYPHAYIHIYTYIHTYTQPFAPDLWITIIIEIGVVWLIVMFVEVGTVLLRLTKKNIEREFQKKKKRGAGKCQGRLHPGTTEDMYVYIYIYVYIYVCIYICMYIYKEYHV